MSHLHEQIAIERQRIAVFEAKIANCKKRIESLEFLIRDSDDELDTLASNTANINSRHGGQITHGVGEAKSSTRKRPIGEEQLKLLKFIGSDGKALKDLVVFSKEKNLGMNDTYLRNFASIYRKRYGLLESPHTGFYRLTVAGQNAVNSAKE